MERLASVTEAKVIMTIIVAQRAFRAFVNYFDFAKIPYFLDQKQRSVRVILAKRIVELLSRRDLKRTTLHLPAHSSAHGTFFDVVYYNFILDVENVCLARAAPQVCENISQELTSIAVRVCTTLRTKTEKTRLLIHNAFSTFPDARTFAEIESTAAYEDALKALTQKYFRIRHLLIDYSSG